MNHFTQHYITVIIMKCLPRDKHKLLSCQLHVTRNRLRNEHIEGC